MPPVNLSPAPGKRCWTAGWDKNGAQTSDIIIEVDLNIISHEKCMETKNSGYLQEASMICAGFLEGGKDACDGDSGGALICAD